MAKKKADTAFMEGLESQTDVAEISQLEALVSSLITKREKIADAEKRLKELKEEETLLSQTEIPDFMKSKGVMKLTLNSGVSVEVIEKVSCSLPKKDLLKRKNALDWIRENGGENLINVALEVTEPDEELKKFLAEEGLPYRNIEDVHHARLRTFITGKLGMSKGSLPEMEIADIPKEFNLFVYHETKTK